MLCSAWNNYPVLHCRCNIARVRKSDALDKKGPEAEAYGAFFSTEFFGSLAVLGESILQEFANFLGWHDHPVKLQVAILGEPQLGFGARSPLRCVAAFFLRIQRDFNVGNVAADTFRVAAYGLFILYDSCADIRARQPVLVSR